MLSEQIPGRKGEPVIDAIAGQVPPGWTRAGDTDAIPLWKRDGEACYVATHDMDQLRFLGAALARFDQMSGPELRAFVQRHAQEEGSQAVVREDDQRVDANTS